MRRFSQIIALLLASSAAAQDSSGLHRLTARADLLGWEAVGRLDLGGRGFCTATLIAPNLVLTAAHCVYDRSTGLMRSAQDITFRAGLRDGAAVVERRAAQIAAHPGFNASAPLSWDNIRHDVALLQLDEAISSTDADPFIVHDGVGAGTQISVTSYGRGRAEALSRQRHCNVMAAQNELFMFDCDVTFGSSGAPVFAKVGGRGRILSVVSGGGTYEGRKVAYGMALTQRVRELKAQLRRSGPVPNAKPIRRIKSGSASGSRSVGGARFVKPNGS